jgi:hypothetical protein
MNLSRRSALFGAGFGLLGPRMVLAQPVAVVTRENVDRRLPELDNFVLETLRQTGVPGCPSPSFTGIRSSI